jgi:hypothetical protein
MPTLPARVVCHCLAAIWSDRLAKLLERTRQRRGPELATAQRQAEKARQTSSDLYHLSTLLPPERSVDAAVAGLLAAAAWNYAAALPQLEDRLEELGHPRLTQIIGTPSGDFVALVRLIVEG